MYYVLPGAGSVALACEHNVRYPDLCEECNRNLMSVSDAKEQSLELNANK